MIKYSMNNRQLSILNMSNGHICDIFPTYSVLGLPSPARVLWKLKTTVT